MSDKQSTMPTDQLLALADEGFRDVHDSAELRATALFHFANPHQHNPMRAVLNKIRGFGPFSVLRGRQRQGRGGGQSRGA